MILIAAAMGVTFSLLEFFWSTDPASAIIAAVGLIN
jgi:hypothetical protein